jgi:cytochrome bd-type quinol oxidase subunit 1
MRSLAWNSNPAFLSRLQFAFVISFHIVFPAFTIGLAAWLATIESAPRGSSFDR